MEPSLLSGAKRNLNLDNSQLGLSGSQGATGGILSERVTRISEKINEIHTNIEKGKSGKLDEYNRKVSQLESKFDEAIDASENKFKIVDDQIENIRQYLQQD